MSSLFRVSALCALLAAPIFFSVSPSRAACTRTVNGNICALFDPTSETTVVETGGFTGSAMSANNVTRARVRFAVNGSWALPVYISEIQITGPGINAGTPLAFSDVSPAANNTYVMTNHVNLDTPIMDWSWTSTRLSFTIPANVANIPIGGNPVDWSSISAIVQYSNDLGPDNSDVLNSSRLQFTASNPAPAPLPILGAASAFTLSRRLRRRISKSA